MSLRRKAIRGGMVLGLGRFGGQTLSFLRNLILARMLGPENFGIGATFAVTLALIEAISSVATDRLLVQASDGEDERFQSTAQATMVLRGLVLGVIIFALAWVVAGLFGNPNLVWAYQCVGLLPLVRGFNHLDAKRRHRQMDYRADVTVELGIQFTLLALAWPLSLLLGDYRAMLFTLLAWGVAEVIGTHIVSHRRYQLSWDRAYVRRIVIFGWPLMVNGVLMFIILQGDVFLIGSAERLFGTAYGMADVGQFAAAAGLALAVEMALASVVSSLFLPMLSAVQDKIPEFRDRYRQCLRIVLAVSVPIAVGAIVLGPAAFSFVYGVEYAVAGALFPWLMGMQCLRLLRVAPTIAAMARADTATTMYVNGVRALGVFGVGVILSRNGSLIAVAGVCCATEACSTVYAFFRLQRQHFRVKLAGSEQMAVIGQV